MTVSRVLFVTCDVSYTTEVESAAQSVRKFLGGIDILVNISGISPKCHEGFEIPIYALTTAQGSEVIQVNLNSMFYFFPESCERYD